MDFIKNSIEKIKNLDRKKLLAGIFGIILLIALPVTIFTVQNRQNIASQAGNPVTVTLQPVSGNIILNQTLDVQVILKAGSISVQTAEFTISYGQPGQADKITAEFTPNPNSGFTALYTPPVETNTSAKSITYKTAVNVGTANISGDVVLGTLRLTGVTMGAAEVRFSGGAFNELSGELTPTFINGNYTVTTSTPATATPIPTMTATTISAANIQQTSATLRGNINAAGLPSNVYFKYSTTNGTCDSFTTKTSQTSYTASTISKTETKTINNLQPNTVYYYCVVIEQTGSTNPQIVRGDVLLFKTPAVVSTATPIPATSTPIPATSTPIPATSTPIPATNTPIPAPIMTATTTSSTNILQTGATLRGTINAAGLPSKVYFRYSTTNGPCQSLTTKTAENSYTASSSTRSVSRPISGLQPNTRYYYCVVVEQTGSTNPQIVRGNVLSLNTPAVVSTNTPIPATNTPIPATNTPVASTNSPIPATASPLPSPNNSQAKLAIAVKLPGIGNNNNGLRPSLGENNNPSTQRAFDVVLYDSEAKQVGSPRSTQFTYSPTDGSYKGEVILSGIPFNSVYEIKVKTNNSLQKRLGFVEQLEAGKTISINANNSTDEIITGKVNLTTPNLIGLQDYNDFMKCFRKLSTCTAAMKTRADFTDDGKVELKDLNILLSAFANRQGD